MEDKSKKDLNKVEDSATEKNAAEDKKHLLMAQWDKQLKEIEEYSEVVIALQDIAFEALRGAEYSTVNYRRCGVALKCVKMVYDKYKAMDKQLYLTYEELAKTDLTPKEADLWEYKAFSTGRGILGSISSRKSALDIHCKNKYPYYMPLKTRLLQIRYPYSEEQVYKMLDNILMIDIIFSVKNIDTESLGKLYHEIVWYDKKNHSREEMLNNLHKCLTGSCDSLSSVLSGHYDQVSKTKSYNQLIIANTNDPDPDGYIWRDGFCYDTQKTKSKNIVENCYYEFEKIQLIKEFLKSIKEKYDINELEK